MSRRAQILSHRKREKERLGMHAVGGGGAGQIGRKKERKKERKELTITTWAKAETETKRKKGLDTCKARVAPTCYVYNKVLS
jgi:hypothetical protein